MQNHDILLRMVLAILCLTSMHCARIQAPRDWLDQPAQVPAGAYGGWITIRTKNALSAGELIAVMPDTVFVADSLLHAVPSSDILSARLVTYDAGGSMPDLVLLGTISTISNGVLLVLTMPMWLIGGSIAASDRSFDPVIDYPDKPLKRLVPYARFPQGVPTGLDRGTVRMKPVPKPTR